MKLLFSLNHITALMISAVLFSEMAFSQEKSTTQISAVTLKA
jgi:hypothetical protein